MKNIKKTFWEKIEEDYYTSKVNYALDKEKYREDEARLKKEFKQDLFEEFDITDNPKREKLWDIAWSEGHSCGYREVYTYAEELVELIK